jgi:hypothetical protein
MKLNLSPKYTFLGPFRFDEIDDPIWENKTKNSRGKKVKKGEIH